MNPHNWLSRLGKPPLDFWQCQYCNEKGTFEQLQKIECSFIYSPCEYCGETPECAIDCSGILEILNSQGIYIAGMN